MFNFSYTLALIIVFFPLLAAVLIFINLSQWSVKKVQYIAIGAISGSLFSACYLFYTLYTQTVFFFQLTLGLWFSLSTPVYWGFLIDELTVAMFFVVSLISLIVYLFSIDYMKYDPNIKQFFVYLLLFSFFMLVLVSSDNLVQLFIGWEGVGLCSFLLISFWITRLPANKAALKAMIVNRIGDNFILVAVCFFLQSCGTVSFLNLFYYPSNLFGNSIYSLVSLTYTFFGISFHYLSVVGLITFLGIMAKSAQFGFHTWLPDAMEGPTPVSALIHAATMVTAGVFLFLRLSHLYVLTTNIVLFIVCISILTTLFAGTVALVQNDIKKVIAYSTCSQLGYMITACGLSFFSGAFFHLVCHALFKALLFLGAGSIIHTLSDEQDIRRMGGLAKLLPITLFTFFIASVNLMGFPFTSGFYSKDLLLEVFFSHNSSIGCFAYFWSLVGAGLTTLYSLRLLDLVFFSDVKWYKYYYINLHANTKFIILSLLILAFLALSFGKIFQSTFFLFFSVNYYTLFVLHIPLYVKILPFFLLIILSFFYYFTFPRYFNSKIYTFFVLKWYVDILNNIFVTHKIFTHAFKFFFLQLEKGWIEKFGPTGLIRFFYFSKNFFLLQYNTFHSFLTFFIVLACFVIFF